LYGDGLKIRRALLKSKWNIGALQRYGDDR
jgi:hypothetical protein